MKNRGELKNQLNQENWKKNNKKNQTMKKNGINWLEFLKKPTSSVRFWFYKFETEKTKQSQIQTEKTEPNQKNRAKLEKKPVFILK